MGKLLQNNIKKRIFQYYTWWN